MAKTTGWIQHANNHSNHYLQCCHVAGLSRYLSAPPLANMKFTNGIHMLDITFNSKLCK